MMINLLTRLIRQKGSMVLDTIKASRLAQLAYTIMTSALKSFILDDLLKLLRMNVKPN